jgi:hypothetical protein
MGQSTLKPEFPPLLAPGFHSIDLAGVYRLCVAGKRFELSVSRKAVFEGFRQVVEALNQAGVNGQLWIDGSFVTEKIDPHDVDMLLHVQSSEYDGDADKREVISWATSPELLESHSCDSYCWVEYSSGHPLALQNNADRQYWSDWFGFSRPPQRTPKGIAVLSLPAKLP